ncbi:hypothetical protein GC194_03105 [bacterium]|nr:hypothetical protein [bacterium]
MKFKIGFIILLWASVCTAQFGPSGFVTQQATDNNAAMISGNSGLVISPYAEIRQLFRFDISSQILLSQSCKKLWFRAFGGLHSYGKL